MLTKLDNYDYEINDGYIRLRMSGMTDPDMVDVMSEIDRSRGRIYVESRYFNYLGYSLTPSENRTVYMDLNVEEVL